VTLTTKEIFDAATEVVQLVQKHTDHVPTAMRILTAAKQGFNPDPDRQPLLSDPERPSEAPVSREGSDGESR
jgi:hypothetical protein